MNNINLKSSRVKNNKFTIYGPNCEFLDGIWKPRQYKY